MSWNVRLGDRTYNSLDLTLEEIGALETISGEPWVLINPMSSIRSAKAYLAVFALRDGTPEDVVVKGLDTLTLREIRGAFDWIDDEKPAPARKARKKGKALDPTNSGPTSGRGSTTELPASDGPPT